MEEQAMRASDYVTGPVPASDPRNYNKAGPAQVNRIAPERVAVRGVTTGPVPEPNEIQVGAMKAFEHVQTELGALRMHRNAVAEHLRGVDTTIEQLVSQLHNLAG